MFEELKRIYKGKRVFLTGHTGFKGAWMLNFLSLLGANVKGYALQPKTEIDLFNLTEGDSLCESVIGDIRDADRLSLEISSFRPDFVFHLAAQPLVRLSYEQPVETFEVNAIGTANVLEAVRRLANPCAIVLITTDKVYHNKEWEYPYRENDRLGGYDPYSASKACAELIIDSYRNSFFNSKNLNQHKKGIAVARAGNVIGGGDWSKDRLIPDIIKAFSIGQPVLIRNPQAIRPWQHVLEPIFGYLLLGARLYEDPLGFSKEYNFGPEVTDALTVEEMMKLAQLSWPDGTYVIDGIGGQLHEAGLLKLDISKVAAELHWHPRMNAKLAVKMTMDWYKEFKYNIGSISCFTREQINDFLNG
ncbi:CDP-glucose 4,6-dehydratase [Sphingobacterium psychroaquaticum]|nr:CDP-glucose 4,6-dehydratase [Sphingobacterium psychroaquaticum]QBQ42690.1 CDP-glucose 4,6-dehydratase [Sphingobacterium psychroaquaticum]